MKLTLMSNLNGLLEHHGTKNVDPSKFLETSIIRQNDRFYTYSKLYFGVEVEPAVIFMEVLPPTEFDCL